VANPAKAVAFIEQIIAKLCTSRQRNGRQGIATPKRYIAHLHETVGQHNGRQGGAILKRSLAQLCETVRHERCIAQVCEFGTSFEIDAKEGFTFIEGSVSCSLMWKIHNPDGGDVRVPDGEDDNSFTERP